MKLIKVSEDFYNEKFSWICFTAPISWNKVLRVLRGKSV